MPVTRTLDRGAALLFAVAGLAVVAALAAVLLNDAQRALQRSERFGDRAAADATLDVAVSTAWGEILAGATASFTESGTTATGTWSVQARPVGTERWDLTATATVAAEEATAQVTLGREPAQPYTLLVGDMTTGPLTGRVDGRVGITGTATIGGRSPGDVQELIGPDARCTGCSDPIVVEQRWARPAPPAGLPVDACPAVTGEITGSLTGGRTYVCTDPGPLRLTGTITVTGPVILELGRDVELVLDTVVANAGGDADELVIVAPEITTIDALDAELNGIVLADSAVMRSTDLRWRGSIVVGTLETAAGSRLDGRWDAALERLGFQGWRITRWTSTTA